MRLAGLGSDGTNLCGVLAWWTLRVGGANVGLGAATRCEGFEKSVCARLALGLGGGGTGCLSVLARRALGVGDALKKRTTC